MNENFNALDTVSKKPTVLSINADKGGVGKSRLSILLSKCLAASGYKICVFDFDSSTHSSTNFFLKTDEESYNKARKSHNTALAIFDETNNLYDYALPTDFENLYLIPFSRNLSSQRTIEYSRLEKIVKNTTGFDFVIIDCAPAYDNFKINAIRAADFNITPCLQDNDSFDSANDLLGHLMSEIEDKIPTWFITINGYNKRWEESYGGKQKEYIDRYEQTFAGHITPRSCWLPWTQDVNEINDRKKLLSNKNYPNTVNNPALYDAVCNLAECFIDEETLHRPEVF